MNKEAIIKLISEPNQLSKVSMEELEEMVHKYPYFHQLHGLLQSKKKLMEANHASETDIIENDNEKKESHQPYTFINDDNDADEFEELEEENSQLPFHDASLKYNTNNHKVDSAINNSTEPLKETDTPEEIVEEDMARLLHKAGLANADVADDLTLVNSITAKTQTLLNNNGLYTYGQLKKLEENDELELLAKIVGKKADAINLWKEECAILYQNKYHRLFIEKIGLALKNKQSNLQKINGIGPILEAKLNEVGVLTYQQLAVLQKPDIEILTELIDYFSGRIERDDWVAQAALKHKEHNPATEIKKEGLEQNNEIARLKAKVEAHKNLKDGIGVTANSNNQPQNEDTNEQSRESFRDWLSKMNHASDKNDEKKNLLVSDLTNKPPT